MHSKVFEKLKKTLKPSRPGKKNPKKPKKNPKKKPQKNPKKTQKNPLGWVFLKKPGFFPTLCFGGTFSASRLYIFTPRTRFAFTKSYQAQSSKN